MMKMYLKTNITALLLFCFMAANLFAQQNGSIRGKVTTSDGQPAEYVSVGLLGKNSTTITNQKGDFRFGALKPGEYTVRVSAVGLLSEEKQVTVTAGTVTTIDFSLTETSSQLKQVIIERTRNRYSSNRTSRTLRVDEDLQKIPQNIQVVTSGVLEDQQVISMSDGLVRNVSGAARVEHWGDLYANITMRGSQIQAFRNGMNVVNSYWGPLTEDMSFVDHIEFVKGPAGFMLANGDPSGLYNVVTKKPTGTNKGEASFTLGSFDLYRAALDLDGSLSKSGKVLYRLNLAGQNKNSFRPYEYNNRYSIAPVVSYRINEKTKLTAEYTLQHAKMSNVGSFYVFSPTGYEALPREFTLLAPGLSPTVINDHSAFLNLEHNINDNWRLTAQAAYFNYQQAGSSMWPSDVLANGKVRRRVSIWDAASEMTLGQLFLNGKVKTGAIDHRILAGLDLGTKNYLADWGQSHDLDSVNGEFDPHNPVYGFPNNGYPQFDRSLNLEARAVSVGGLMDQRYTGVYFQDQLGFFDDRLRLTLAGRYTFVSESTWGGTPQTAKHFTPRVGLSASITPQTAVYALYDQAFIPQNGLLVGGESAQPITGNNLEAGVKKDWFGGRWNSTLSLYRILKNNEITSAGNPNSNESIEIGQKTVEGVEVDIRGEISRGLSLTANYAYTDAKVTKVNQGVSQAVAYVGQRIPGSNEHTMNAWLSYKLTKGALKGIGLSTGLTHLINRATGTFSASNPEHNLPDYFKLDAGAFWEKDNLKITMNAFNILDENLYSGAYYTNYFSNAAYSWQTEAPRNYRLSIAYKF